MAQFVGYFDNDVVYTEGPFVLTSIFNEWRLEAELKGHKCPALTDLSIDKMIWAELGVLHPKGSNKLELVVVCNWLNEQVTKGHIIVEKKQWVAPQYKNAPFPRPTLSEMQNRRLNVF